MRYVTKLIRFIIVVIVVVFMGHFAPAASAAGQDEALESYHLGIAAKTIGEREHYFEKALELYLAQYNQMKREGAVNGLLCYNIGNCYFNLEQNEEAIFYYQLGKVLLPTNAKIRANLAEALAKRKNAVDVESGGLVENLLFLHYKISPFQKVNILVGLAILAALSLTWLILQGNIIGRYLSIFSCIAVLGFSLSIGVDYYRPSHVGIIMKQTDIRRGAGSGFAPLTVRPLGGGSSVLVLSLANGWYSVKLNDGRQGYIPQESLKVVVI